MRFDLVGFGFGAVLLSIAAGCGGGGGPAPPPLVPVSGTVTLDGKPLANASVTFLPVGGTRGARSPYGFTGADGRYELVFDNEHKGAPEGEFEVLCNKWVMPDGSDFPRDSGQSPVEVAKELLPSHYSQEGMSKLRATVPAGGGTIDFQLTSK